MLTGAVTEESVAGIEALHRPWVVLGDHHCTRPLHHVTVDFRTMGRLAVRQLAELRGIAPEEMGTLTGRNFMNFLGLE